MLDGWGWQRFGNLVDSFCGRLQGNACRFVIAVKDLRALGRQDHTPWMKDIKERRSNTHQCSIKDVDVYFGRLKRPIRSCDVLDNAEDRSDHDEAARNVENEDESLPRSRDRQAFPGRVFVDAAVEDM